MDRPWLHVQLSMSYSHNVGSSPNWPVRASAAGRAIRRAARGLEVVPLRLFRVDTFLTPTLASGMQLLHRALILTHRYLGIPLSAVFVLWFVTGIAMIYVGGMPALAPQARLERLPALDLDAVKITPATSPSVIMRSPAPSGRTPRIASAPRISGCSINCRSGRTARSG